MFRVNSNEKYCACNNDLNIQVDEDIKIYSNKIFNQSSEKNNEYLNNEIIKINNWAEDKIQAIELEVEQMREQRKELRKQSDLCANATDKLRIENEKWIFPNIKTLILNANYLTEEFLYEISIDNKYKMDKLKRLELSENEQAVEEKRNSMVESIKKESMKTSELKVLFTVEFEVV